MDKTICSKCICDTSIPGISFDDRRICNFCQAHDRMEKQFPLNEEGQRKLNKLVEEVKAKGKGNKYDCLVGISGGTDSTYLLYMSKKMGLRPLAVHFDNGWDSEIAIKNIEKAVSKLDVDLKAVTCDRDEFRDLQISFLKASVPDAEIPTDIAYKTILYRVAAEEGVHNILIGHSFRVEGFAPKRWTHQDGKYIKSVHRIFGQSELRTYPNFTISDLLYYTMIKRIRWVYPLPYINYHKEDSKKLLKKETGWEDYGGHHFDSTYTRFIGSYLLPRKFKIDKRIIEYSAYVRSGQMTRNEALEKIKEPYPDEPELVQYVLDRLGLTNTEFQNILSTEPKTFLDYSTYYSFIRAMRIPIKIACMLGLLPHIFYEKYFG